MLAWTLSCLKLFAVPHPWGINNFHLCVAPSPEWGWAVTGRCTEVQSCSGHCPSTYQCDFFISSHLDLIDIKNIKFLSKNSLLLKESHSSTNPGPDTYHNSLGQKVPYQMPRRVPGKLERSEFLIGSLPKSLDN